MVSKTEICNLALRHVGSGKTIEDFDTDPSEEGRACRAHFQIVFNIVLEDAPWPFARKFATLALISEKPTTEWLYSYGYPTDCAWFKRILSGDRNDSQESRVKYIFAYGNAGREIYTDQQEAVAEYTVRVPNTERLPSSMMNAFALRLAMTLFPALSANGSDKAFNRLVKLYDFEIAKARSGAFNEEQPDDAPPTPSIAARE